MSGAASGRLLVMVLPDIGGIGKSTVSEQLVAMLEIARRPVVAIDGDHAARGLIARRHGRRTVPVRWPAEPRSRGDAIRAAVPEGHVGVLDLGAGSASQPSIDLTIADLCDGSTSHGIETVVIVIGEASKPGLSVSIARLRAVYPHVRYVFCRNHKSGSDFTSFTGCDDLPSFDLPPIPVALTEWLSNHGLATDDRGQVSRPALADLVAHPKPGFMLVGQVLGWFLNTVSQQRAMRDLLHLPPTEHAFPLRNTLVLARGPMDDDYMTAHLGASVALSHIIAVKPPQPGQEGPWLETNGRHLLKYARDYAKLQALRLARPA